jgi:hypothetical protein
LHTYFAQNNRIYAIAPATRNRHYTIAAETGYAKRASVAALLRVAHRESSKAPRIIPAPGACACCINSGGTLAVGPPFTPKYRSSKHKGALLQPK